MYFVNFERHLMNCIITKDFDPIAVINAYDTLKAAKAFKAAWDAHVETMGHITYFLRLIHMQPIPLKFCRMVRGMTEADLRPLQEEAFDEAVTRIRRSGRRVDSFKALGRPIDLHDLFLTYEAPDFDRWRQWAIRQEFPSRQRRLPKPARTKRPGSAIQTRDGSVRWKDTREAADALQVPIYCIKQHLAGHPRYPTIRNLKLEKV